MTGYRLSIPTLLLGICVLGLPLADNLSGLLFKLQLISEGGLGSPSQAARFLLILALLAVIMSLQDNVKVVRWVVGVTAFFLIVESVVALFHWQLVPYLFGVVFSLKIVFFVAVLAYFLMWANRSPQHYQQVVVAFIFYGAVIGVLLVVAYASGFHISNYAGRGSATRGLFISGNGLGVTLGASALVALHYFQQHYRLWAYWLGLFMLLCSVLVGTKASLVFTLLGLLYFAALSIIRFPVLALPSLVIGGVYAYETLWFVASRFFENIIYKFNSGYDPLVLLASSRDVFIARAFEVMPVEGLSAIRILFGGGAFYAYEEVGSSLALRKFVENDLFELLFAYGIFAVIAYVATYSYAVFVGLKNRSIVLVGILTLVFLHSVLVGHVLFNGTSSLVLALLYVLVFAKNASSNLPVK